jgi:uncharacterized protein YjbI with pentapeptide repeats
MNKKYFLGLVVFVCSFVNLDALNLNHFYKVCDSRPKQELRGLQLSEACFTQKNKKNLANRIFIKCDFTKAIFDGIVCSGSSFKDCNFSEATIKAVELAGTKFIGCTFTKVKFVDCVGLPKAIFEQNGIWELEGATVCVDGWSKNLSDYLQQR